MRFTLLVLGLAFSTVASAQHFNSKPGTLHLKDGTTLRFDTIGFVESRTQSAYGIELVENGDSTVVPLWHFRKIQFEGPSGGSASVTDWNGGTRRIERYVVGTIRCPRSILFMPENYRAARLPFECLEVHEDVISIEFDSVFGWIAVDSETKMEFPAQYQFNPVTGDSLDLKLAAEQPSWWPTPTLLPIR